MNLTFAIGDALKALFTPKQSGLEGSRQEETPGPYDVLLRMLAVSLSYRDLANARGHYHIAVTSALIWQRAH
jgi:hypothetical protein